MSVLDRSALEASPLADLHAIASELSIDGYRRLRRAELIEAILDKQGGADAGADADEARRSRPAARARRRPAKAAVEEDGRSRRPSRRPPRRTARGRGHP